MKKPNYFYLLCHAVSGEESGAYGELLKASQNPIG